jgi:uncharacterized membrane protein YidH (DUF202 family)
MAYTKLQLYLIDGSILFGISAIAIGVVMSALSTHNVDANLFGRGMAITICGVAILVLSFGTLLWWDTTKDSSKR